MRDALVSFIPLTCRQTLSKEFRIEPWIDSDIARRSKFEDRLTGPDNSQRFRLPTQRAFFNGVTRMSHRMAKRVPPKLTLEELRYPYLDRNLIEFIFAIPATQMLRPGDRRSLMRRSLAGIVPDAILSRRTKQFGARTPTALLDRNWGELQDIFRAPVSSCLGYIDSTRLLQAIDDCRSGKTGSLVRIMKAISLELWLKDLAARGLIEFDLTDLSLFDQMLPLSENHRNDKVPPLNIPY